MTEKIDKKIIRFLEKNKKITNKDLYKSFPDTKQSLLREYKSEFLQSIKQKKTEPTKSKATKPIVKASSNKSLPLSKKVYAYLEKNPTCSNEELYQKFKGQSKSSIRGFKATYFKNKEILKPKIEKKVKEDSTIVSGVKNIKKIAFSKTKKVIDQAEKIFPDSLSKNDLEKKVVKLEKRVEGILELLKESLPEKEYVKENFSKKINVLDNRIKDLEENLLSFIKEKRGKLSNELKNLDDIQNAISNKISSFIKNIKNKYDR